MTVHPVRQVPPPCWLSFIALAAIAGTAWAEAEVPTRDLSLWLRADRAVERDASQAVAAWNNRAPNASLHALQDKAANRPRWVASVVSLAGQPALEFDGQDDFLHLPGLKLGAQTTLFLVAENAPQTKGASHWRTLLGGDDDSFRDGATKYAFGFRNGDFEPRFVTCLYFAPGKPHQLIEPPLVDPNPAFHVYGFSRAATAAGGMRLRIDGVTVASLTADKDPPGFPGQGYTLGQGGHVTKGKPSRFYRGRVAEVLVYDRCLTPGEVLRVEEHLAGKYRLTRQLAPPARALALWLDACSLQPPVAGKPVDRWEDQSGQGRHAVQKETGSRPACRPRSIEGRPAVEFPSPACLDFGSWTPPAGAAVYAAVRNTPQGPAEVVRTLPAIDPRWGEGRAPFRGLLAELLVYDRKLSAVEADEVRRYLENRWSESSDPRYFDNGRLIFRNGYNDQPYVVHCRDGSWLCVITTSAIAESGADRTLVVTRSRDQGRTWSEPQYSIEPPEEMRQPSWATLYATPYGRVYVFYNLREEPHPKRSKIGFYLKYSDDHGATWSTERYPLPAGKLVPDDRSGGWSVCAPIQVGNRVLVSYSRFVPPGRSQGRGFVFRSDNLASERDPAKIRWETMPDAHGIRADDVPSSMQEEHILTPLANGDLCCIWRTQVGYACQGYSRDGGRTWPEQGLATYEPGGRPIRQPLACCRPFRTSDGRYLLWFHNSKNRGPTALYAPRDVVWLAGGLEREGHIHWSQPEVLLYGFDLPVRNLGMSYPDFVEQEGRFWVTTTDKQDARIFPLDPTMLDGLWNQVAQRDGARSDLVTDLPTAAFTQATFAQNDPSKAPRLPSLLHGGFTVDLTWRAADAEAGQVLVEQTSEEGRGWRIVTADQRRLRIELRDGRHPPESWTTDPGLLQPGHTHRVTWIVDGGPNLILVLVDGRLCDGGEEGQCGWGRFSRSLDEIGGRNPVIKAGPAAPGALQGLRLFDRALRVSEAVRLRTYPIGSCTSYEPRATIGSPVFPASRWSAGALNDAEINRTALARSSGPAKVSCQQAFGPALKRSAAE